MSGLEWLGFGLSEDISCEGKRLEVGEGGEGEEYGEGWFFIVVLFTELPLSRLRRRLGTDPSSTVKEVVELDGLPFSWWWWFVGE
jgi:hypothetical protein